MANRKRRISVKAGLPPGSLVHIGTHTTESPVFNLFSYNAGEVHEEVFRSPAAVKSFLEKPGMNTWLEVIGVSHLGMIEETGKIFGIHPLVLEDVVNIEQRPKFEDYSQYGFFTLRLIEMDNPLAPLDYSQISIVFGQNFLVSYQDRDNDLFETVKKRLMTGASRARTRDPDFLLYLLTDTIVDSYFSITEKISDALEHIENTMLNDQKGKAIHDLQLLRRNMAMILKSVYPLREALSRLEKRDSKLFREETLLYFRDIYDHTVHIIESIENQRDILAGTLDVYLTEQNNRLNSVMKVLTVIATIFIPLSFLASIYGMNFDHFPELHWKYGYPLFFWIICVLTVAGMIIYFRRKKWL